jgi:hypothetical protein
MPFAIFFFLLLMGSGPVYAEWVKFAKNEEGDVTYYFDPESIDRERLRREGNLVEVSVLLDYSNSQTNREIPYLSSKAQFACNCDEEKQERTMLIASTEFSRNMGHGNVVGNILYLDDVGRSVAPASILWSLWILMCGKK